MIKTSEYLTWIIRNSELLSLKLINIKKPDWYSGQIFVYSASVMIDGIRWDGFGTHIDEHTAIIKAVSEALERSYMKHESVTNSNGFAIHINHELAKSYSLAELIERDAFLTHFYSQTPFLKSNTKLSALISKKDLRSFNKQGITFSTYTLSSAENYHVSAVVASVNYNDINGYNISLGVSDKSYDQSTESATYQLLNSLFYFLKKYKTHEDIVVALEKAKQEKSIHYHALLPFLPEYYAQTSFLFEGNDTTTQNIAMPDDINIKKIEHTSEILKNSPLHCYLATSKKLQNLFFETDNIKSHINIERLKLLNPSITMDTVLDLPHPFD